ncbi:hypothetical protein PYCC9005_000596 [Savitreella phatthalungensis]
MTFNLSFLRRARKAGKHRDATSYRSDESETLHKLDDDSETVSGDGESCKMPMVKKKGPTWHVHPDQAQRDAAVTATRRKMLGRVTCKASECAIWLTVWPYDGNYKLEFAIASTGDVFRSSKSEPSTIVIKWKESLEHGRQTWHDAQYPWRQTDSGLIVSIQRCVTVDDGKSLVQARLMMQVDEKRLKRGYWVYDLPDDFAVTLGPELWAFAADTLPHPATATIDYRSPHEDALLITVRSSVDAGLKRSTADPSSDLVAVAKAAKVEHLD